MTIWLGEEDDEEGTDRAVALLHELEDHISRASGGNVQMLLQEFRTRAVPIWCQIRAQMLEVINPEGIAKETWASLGAFLRRPWFSRIWVLQEAVMALLVPGASPMITCGHHNFPFNTMLKPLLGLRLLGVDYNLWHWLPKCETNSAHWKPYSGVVNTVRWVFKFGAEVSQPEVVRPNSFKELLTLSKRLDATDPRDKIFALRGMVSQDVVAAADEHLEPNYQHSIEQVYWTVAIHFIYKRNSLRLLELVTDSDRFTSSSLRLPPWLPDWTVPSDLEHFGEMYRAGFTSGQDVSTTMHPFTRPNQPRVKT